MPTIAAYISGTTGGTDGTAVSLDGSESAPIVISTLNTVVTVWVRCTDPFGTPDAVVVTAPTGFSVSADNSTFGATANIGVVAHANVPVYIKQTSNIAGPSSLALLHFDYAGALVGSGTLSRTTAGAKMYDDFQDQDYANNPTWTKDSGDAAVVDDGSGNYVLKLSGATSSFIDTPVTLANSDYISFKVKSATDAVGRIELCNAARSSDLSFIFNYATNGNLELYIDEHAARASHANPLVGHTDWHTMAIKWDSTALTWYVDGVSEIATTDDHSKTSQDQVWLFAGGGTTPANCDIRFDNVAVMDSWNVSCTTVPAGYKFKVVSSAHSAGDTVADGDADVVEHGTNSGGSAATVTLDLSGKCAFPYHSAVVTDAADRVTAVLAPTATISGRNNVAGVFGGDVFAYA